MEILKIERSIFILKKSNDFCKNVLKIIKKYAIIIC